MAKNNIKLPRLVYISWADSVGRPHYNPPGAVRPKPVIADGVSWIVEIQPDYIVVAHFTCDDGGEIDMVAISRDSILEMKDIEIKDAFQL